MRSLRFAAAAAAVLGDRSFNTSRWIDVSNRISLVYDAAADYHPEFAGYKGKTVKQADVVLLPFPLLMPMNSSTRLNDLKFYENRTDNGGPAMTWAMFAIGHWDVGDVDEAQSLFNRSYANVQEPYGVWTETPSGGTTNFITGAGGFLQGVINGLAGVRLGAASSGGSSSITFHPQCSSSLAASSGAVNGVCVRPVSSSALRSCFCHSSLCERGADLRLSPLALDVFLTRGRCRYFRGWRLTFEWTTSTSAGQPLPTSTVTGFKSPLSPDDASPALAVAYQGKSLELREGEPLSFDGCPAVAVVLA